MIVTEAQLLELAGLRQRSALRRWLRKARIPFLELRGVIFTTQDALNAVLVGRERSNRKEPNFDALTAKSP